MCIQGSRLLNTCDPADPFSICGPFDIGFGRITHRPSNYAVLLDGLPIMTVELGSGTLKVRHGLVLEDMQVGLSALRHLVDNSWPARPTENSSGASPPSTPPSPDRLREFY